jgi:hypothetical protein
LGGATTVSAGRSMTLPLSFSLSFSFCVMSPLIFLVGTGAGLAGCSFTTGGATGGRATGAGSGAGCSGAEVRLAAWAFDLGAEDAFGFSFGFSFSGAEVLAGGAGVLLGLPGRCASGAAAAAARTGRATQPSAAVPTACPSTVVVRQTRWPAASPAAEPFEIVLPASAPESGSG